MDPRAAYLVQLFRANQPWYGPRSIHIPGTWNARNLLTVLEVAEWARVHPKTVYPWMNASG